MENILKESIGIVSDFIGRELAILEISEQAEVLDQLNNIAINPSIILSERDRLNFERDVNDSLDTDFLSILNDAAVDLHATLEGSGVGRYDQLVEVITNAATIVNRSSLVPTDWKQEDEDIEPFDIGHVLRFILGYVMRDIPVPTKPQGIGDE